VYCIINIYSCDYFKTKYEEIRPEFPDLQDIKIIDSIDYNFSISDLIGNEIPLSGFKNKVWEHGVGHAELSCLAYKNYLIQ
jgi:hypothetical protein